MVTVVEKTKSPPLHNSRDGDCRGEDQARHRQGKRCQPDNDNKCPGSGFRHARLQGPDDGNVPDNRTTDK